MKNLANTLKSKLIEMKQDRKGLKKAILAWVKLLLQFLVKLRQKN